jgi:hypothetical protein
VRLRFARYLILGSSFSRFGSIGKAQYSVKGC